MPTPRKYPRIKITGRPGEHLAHLVMSETETIALAGSWSTPEVAFAAAQAELVNEQATRAGTQAQDVAVAIVTPTAAPVPLAAAPAAVPAPAAPRSGLPVPVPTRCPECKRRVRRASEAASKWPGTVVMADRTGICPKCKKSRQQQTESPTTTEGPAPIAATTLALAPAADDLVEQLEPEPSKPKSRKRRTDAGKAWQGRPDKTVPPPRRCPKCNRLVRPRKAKAEDHPGTVQAIRANGTCVTCIRTEDHQQENRRAARSDPQPTIGPPAPFEEPRRSAVVPTPREKPAHPQPPAEPPPVTVIGSGPITGPLEPFEQTMHSLDAFMARRQARLNRPSPTHLNRKAPARAFLDIEEHAADQSDHIAREHSC